MIIGCSFRLRYPNIATVKYRKATVALMAF